MVRAWMPKWLTRQNIAKRSYPVFQLARIHQPVRVKPSLSQWKRRKYNNISNQCRTLCQQKVSHLWIRNQELYLLMKIIIFTSRCPAFRWMDPINLHLLGKTILLRTIWVTMQVRLTSVKIWTMWSRDFKKWSMRDSQKPIVNSKRLNIKEDCNSITWKCQK